MAIHGDAIPQAALIRSGPCATRYSFLVKTDFPAVYRDHINQMLKPLDANGAKPIALVNPLERDVAGTPVCVVDHCYGCTAGQDSSGGGALVAA